MDCNLPGSPVHGILQARILENILPFPFPGDLSDPGIEPGSPELQVNSLPLSYQGSPKIFQAASEYRNEFIHSLFSTNDHCTVWTYRNHSQSLLSGVSLSVKTCRCPSNKDELEKDLVPTDSTSSVGAEGGRKQRGCENIREEAQLLK